MFNGKLVNRFRFKAVFLILLGVSVVAASTAAAHIPGQLTESPQGQILIVNANLDESSLQSDPDDITDTTDMRVFVERLTSKLPYAPDALLLQEMLTQGATVIIDELENETGYQYELVVDPGETPYLADGSQRETAIILNTDTMSVEDEGGYIRHDYALEDTDRLEPIGKHTAYMLAKERRGALRVSLASLHYVTKPHFKTSALHTQYVDQWTTDIADFLDSEYSFPTNRQISVIAGDTNLTRCDYRDVETISCTESPFYSNLTGTQYDYTDTIDAMYGYSQDALDQRLSTGPRRIDFTFTKGDVLDADRDYQYTPGQEIGNPETFYSDHRLEWSLLGMSTP